MSDDPRPYEGLPERRVFEPGALVTCDNAACTCLRRNKGSLPEPGEDGEDEIVFTYVGGDETVALPIGAQGVFSVADLGRIVPGRRCHRRREASGLMQKRVALVALVVLVSLAGCSSDTSTKNIGSTPCTLGQSYKELPTCVPEPPLKDGEKVSEPLASELVVGSRRYRDGSTLSWTSDGYWYSTDNVFHAELLRSVSGPVEAVEKCSSAR